MCNSGTLQSSAEQRKNVKFITILSKKVGEERNARAFHVAIFLCPFLQQNARCICIAFAKTSGRNKGDIDIVFGTNNKPVMC